MKFRAGDRVRIEGVVEWDQRDDAPKVVFVRLDGDTVPAQVQADHLVFFGRDYRVGDLVLRDKIICEVIGIRGGMLWIEDAYGVTAEVAAGRVAPFEPPPEPEPVEPPAMPPGAIGTWVRGDGVTAEDDPPPPPAEAW